MPKTIAKITGWEAGFNKVQFTRLVRDTTPRGLVESRKVLADVLAKKRVVLEFEDQSIATKFVESAKAMHVLCDLVETTAQ